MNVDTTQEAQMPLGPAKGLYGMKKKKKKKAKGKKRK